MEFNNNFHNNLDSDLEPLRRSFYMLDQMRYHLEMIKSNENKKEEYEQTQIIFNGLLNLQLEKNYKNIIDILKSTSSKINSLYGKNTTYWFEFMKFADWKIKQ